MGAGSTALFLAPKVMRPVRGYALGSNSVRVGLQEVGVSDYYVVYHGVEKRQY